MTNTAEPINAGDQLERAREALGEALGQVQDIQQPDLDLADVSASLAKTVKEIFAVQSQGIDDPSSAERVKAAMEHLGHTLSMLQDVQTDDEALELAASTMARTLALLYPIRMELERMAKAAEAAAQEPLPLTEAAAEPVPLQPKEEPELSDREREARERRVHKRREINTDIGIQSGTNFFTGFSQDISSGGLFMATFDTQPIGTMLNVNFDLPGGSVMSLDGQVQWIREYNETVPDMEPGMGIRFVNVSRQDREAINEYISANQPMFFDDE